MNVFIESEGKMDYALTGAAGIRYYSFVACKNHIDVKVQIILAH